MKVRAKRKPTTKSPCSPFRRAPRPLPLRDPGPSLAPAYDLLRGVILAVQNFLEEQGVHLTLGSYEKVYSTYVCTVVRTVTVLTLADVMLQLVVPCGHDNSLLLLLLASRAT